MAKVEQTITTRTVPVAATVDGVYLAEAEVEHTVYGDGMEYAKVRVAHNGQWDEVYYSKAIRRFLSEFLGFRVYGSEQGMQRATVADFDVPTIEVQGSEYVRVDTHTRAAAAFAADGGQVERTSFEYPDEPEDFE